MPKPKAKKELQEERKRVAGQASTSPQVSTSTSASELKWNKIRPWKGPEDSGNDEDTAVPSGAVTPEPESRSGCLSLEVIDVSSTSVALAILSIPSMPSTPSVEIIEEPPTPVAGPSSTMVNRRDRSISNASNKATTPTTHAAIPPPAISIRLNSVPWPHVLHSDPAFLDHGQSSKHSSQGVPSATIVVYNLEPGKEYEVELDVVDQSSKPDSPISPARSLPALPNLEEPRSKFTTTSIEPDGPPPPYSSLDPSSSSPPRPSLPASSTSSSSAISTPSSHPSEAQLRSSLKEVKAANKQAEQALQASIGTIKRALEKSTREDLRARQRISTLEETTRKIKESLVEDAGGLEGLLEELKPLQEEEKDWQGRVERCKIRIITADAEARVSMEADELELKNLTSALEEVGSREEGLILEKSRYENEVVPDLNITLANLEAEIRRLDHTMYLHSQHPQQLEHPITRSAVGSFKRQKQQMVQESYFPSLNNPQRSVSASTPPKMQNRKRAGSDESTSRQSITSSYIPGLFRKNSDLSRVVSSPSSLEPIPAAQLSDLGLTGATSQLPSTAGSSSKFLASLRRRSGGVNTIAMPPSTPAADVGSNSEADAEKASPASVGKKPWSEQITWSKVVGSRKTAPTPTVAE